MLKCIGNLMVICALLIIKSYLFADEKVLCERMVDGVDPLPSFKMA